MSARAPRVAFLFLGETLLIPHLYPIVEALAEARPDIGIDLWVSTSVHETLLTRWTTPLAHPDLRIRRAPGFLRVADDGTGRNPPLPAKLPLLARLTPYLARTAVVVVAEQTSLWVPTLLPFLKTRFVDTFHGAGTVRTKKQQRRRSAWRVLTPSDRERDALVESGVRAERAFVTGYVKAGFRHRTPLARMLAEGRPTVLYTPHWQRYRSSWWDWGPEVVRWIAADGRWNLIFAPHQRLPEKAEDVRAVAAEVADLPHVHVDLDSFAMVDGSYTAAADIYLGDTSSQLCEFVARPRPAVFLNNHARDWENDPAYVLWRCGEVVDAVERVTDALAAAPARHPDHAAFQAEFAAESLGNADGSGPIRAAEHVIAALEGGRGGAKSR